MGRRLRDEDKMKLPAKLAVALLLAPACIPMAVAQSSASAPGASTARTPSHAAATSETFTTAVADDLLFQVAEGMESRNARRSLGAFDAEKLSGYSRFSDQMNAWFREYTSFRVYYKLKQVFSEPDGQSGRGVALVDFEYEATPSAEGASPLRRHQQVRFSFARGAKGWKIVEFSPRSLFS